MASVRLQFVGLDALLRQLRDLPRELAAEGGAIVARRADAAAAAIRAGYPVVTGNLRDHVSVVAVDSGPFGAGFVVRNTARHAWLYDQGTNARHHADGTPTGAMWGGTDPPHLFVRELVLQRRDMYEDLKALLARAGFVVSGEER